MKLTESVIVALEEGIANGLTLRQICRDDFMPTVATVLGWVGAPEGFNATLRARLISARARACLFHEDALITLLGIIPVDQAHASALKLQRDIHVLFLKAWSPERYSERLKVDHGFRADDLAELQRAKAKRIRELADRDDDQLGQVLEHVTS